MTIIANTQANATAFVQFESQELVSAVGARVALALLRRDVGGDLTKAATAINEALNEHKGADNRRYWLAPNGEVPRTTKEMKSHHKKYWQIAGNLLKATEQGSEQGFTALPESNAVADILDWLAANDLSNATLEMLESALGRRTNKDRDTVQGGRAAGETGQQTAAGKGTPDSNAPANEADAAGGSEAAHLEQQGVMLASLAQQLSNVLATAGNLPATSKRDLLALVAHYEQGIREVLDVVQPKG